MTAYRGSDLKPGMVFALTATTLTIEEVIEIDDPAGKLARIKYTRRGKGHAEAMDGESIIFANDTFISAELMRETSNG